MTTISHAPRTDHADPPREGSRGRVLHIGTSYYNNWYLTHALRRRGWIAHTLACSAEGAGAYMHGSDFYLTEYVHSPEQTVQRLGSFFEAINDRYRRDPQSLFSGKVGRLRSLLNGRLLKRTRRALRNDPDSVIGDIALIKRITTAMLSESRPGHLGAYFGVLLRLLRPPLAELEPIYRIGSDYDIIHFTGVNSMRVLYFVMPNLFPMPVGWDVEILKRLGKKIVYSNTGCLDGVSQSSFRQWGPEPVCGICKWRNNPAVCSDAKNLAWGKLRNHLADVVINLGGNRVDYNADPAKVREIPEFYCLNPDVWRPDLPIPVEHRLNIPADRVKIYHAVGDYERRTAAEGQVNIKTTHVIVPTVQQLKDEGHPVEMVFCTGIRNVDVRYYQLQCDIAVDMLTFGFFGANVRECLMLGKVAICYLRPEWMESTRREIPDYVDEMPVISATPKTLRAILLDLIANPAKRAEIGRRSRDFAIKWHSDEAAGSRFDRLYGDLLAGQRKGAARWGLNPRSPRPPR